MEAKTLVKEFIPPIILTIKRKIFNPVKERKPGFQKLAKENTKFKNLHKGERVFILATGPSIKTQNLKPLKNEYCIAVSHFHLHDDIKIINPLYHVLAPQHPPFTFKDSSKYFKDFHNAYDHQNTTIFLGLTNYKYNYLNLLSQYPELSYPRLKYLDYSASRQIDENNFSDDSIWDISKTPFTIRTIIYSAIQVAAYMGFSEIFLIGCDHDYLQDISRTTNHHFYKEEKGISDKEHLEQFTRERWFFEYYMRWKQYRLMNEYAQSKGIKIFNATNGGMLDVFERVNLKDIL